MKFWNNKSKDHKLKTSESQDKFKLSQKFQLNSIYNSFEEYQPQRSNLISDEFLEKQFEELFSEEIINLSRLKKLAWNGIPSSHIIFFQKPYNYIYRIPKWFMANFVELPSSKPILPTHRSFEEAGRVPDFKEHLFP